MKQIQEIKIDSPIIPNQGIGEIKLGMNSFYLREFFSRSFQDKKGIYSSLIDERHWNVELWTPFFGKLSLNYNNILTITINLFNGCISNLRVKNNYKGKIDRIAGIGDSVRAYYQRNKSNFYEYDEGSFFFIIDQEFGLSLFIGEIEGHPNEELFEEYLDKPILEIEILDYRQSIPVGAPDLPDNWKIKS